MRKYYAGITLFKLTGSLLVVLAHIMFFQYIEYIPGQQMQFVLLITRVIVPCFYVVAGFLAYKGWSHATNSKLYVRKYILRIAWMYAFFCLLFMVEFTVPDFIQHGLSFGNLYLQAKILFIAVFLNGPFLQLWFIPPLLFSILASFWLIEKQFVRLAAALALFGFLICQFVSGTLMTVFTSAGGSFPFLHSTYFNYLDLFVTRYMGFGFTFVLAGVLLAKYEEKFVSSKLVYMLIPAVLLTLAETLFLLRFAQWSAEFKLAFSILPNTLFMFYGILRIQMNVVQAYHKWINLFSIVAFCGHILFMRLNLFLFDWELASISIAQSLILVLLTLIECLAVTFLFMLMGKNTALKPVNRSIP
jgi:hypothetical protein